MRMKLFAGSLALLIAALMFPALANAQGRGNGWGNSPYARRMKMERKIQKERSKFRRKVAQQRFRDRQRARRAANNDYYVRRDRDDRYARRDRDGRYYGNYDPYYDDDYYDDDYYYRRGSVYDRHRNVINIGIGAGVGAAVGAIVDGKKGALIGAGVGAAAGAVYTYGINPKNKRRPRYYRD